MTVSTFTSVIHQLLPEPHAGLLSGILFGTKAAIPKDFIDALIATGTLHIVALSGTNITILETLIGETLGRVFNKRAAGVCTILLICGFIWFVGPSPSVIRAGIMGSIALLATIFGRQKWSLFFFFLTALVMLIIHPGWITDLSFQLSAGATLGIILFGKKQKNFLLDDLQTTLSAQVFTIPIILLAFRRISFVSPLTNVLIGWIIQPLTVVGLIVVFAGLVWLPLGAVVSWVAWVMLQYVILAIEWTAKLSFSNITF